MSLIEKAVNKLGGKPEQAEQAAPPAERVEPHIVAEPPRPRAAEPAVETHIASQSVNVSLARLKSSGFVTMDGDRTEISEEFRLIKRPLLTNAFAQGHDAIPRGNLIMVTSALPGEGKSFCTLNLALSIALEMDRTVLLIDADVAKPKLLQYMGVRAERGLLDVLRGGVSLPDVLLRTNIENLTVLPAGRPTKHATELLASEAMNSLIEDMATRYKDRLVIVDSPPLLATSEASVLASHMGQIVLVVEADKTPQAAVREAIGHIEDSGALISLMLNKTTGPKGAGYYGYGYGKYGT